MKIETDDLKRVNTYAREQGITTQGVYKRIANNAVKFVLIDGMKFVYEEK